MTNSESGGSANENTKVARLVYSEYQAFSKLVGPEYYDSNTESRLVISFFANLKLSNPSAYQSYKNEFRGAIDFSVVDEMENDELRRLADDSDFNKVMNDMRNEMSEKRADPNL